MKSRHLILGCQGCGSAIVEAAFELAGISYEREEVDYSADSPTRARLVAVNPLGQVPTLVMGDGAVLTESLAILHYLDDVAPQAGLIPPRGDAQRARFYRWAVFLVAAVYPTYTYGDEPLKWVNEASGAKQLRESTDRQRGMLWRQLEAEARAPWLLGERMSALDLYLAVMTHWRPGSAWFAANTPKIMAIAARATALPPVGRVVERNFS
ncbi:MAG TPA: glutathione S-transferase family protein [Usitatibacter sp.]|nr:glutathione S-transferase family protein [Usitatibacter sp.]